MSAVPPPPPFQATPGAPFPAGWDRKILREQRRAAAFQARQQRIAYRAQMRAMRRTSIVGPLLLLTLGVVFLLLEIGRLNWAPTLNWFAHWWPLLFIVAGFILLAEWALDTHLAQDQAAFLPRRTLGGGAGFLLALLALLGLGAMAAEHGSDWARNHLDEHFVEENRLGLGEFFGARHEADLDVSAPLSNGALLSVENYRGNVTISGSSPDGQVHVAAHQRFFAWQRRDAIARAERERPTLHAQGNGAVLRVGGEGRDQTDLTIQVPHEASVRITGERGEVSISELRGGVTVEDHSGTVVLTALTGPVHLTMRDDNADVSGHSLTGDVTVDGRTGDLAFSDVDGPVTLHGDFFGTTRLERIKGAVHFQSSFTDLKCAGIPGELNVEGRSELRAKDLNGPVTLTTTDRNLTLSGIRGGATVDNRNGSVTMSLLDPLGAVNVNTTDGSVNLQLPEKSAFTLSAETADGQVRNDFGLEAVERDDRASVSGQIKSGGPTIALRTTEGDINVRKAGAADWSDDTDDSDTGHALGSGDNEPHPKRGAREHSFTSSRTL